jgi:hypothetical protein
MASGFRMRAAAALLLSLAVLSSITAAADTPKERTSQPADRAMPFEPTEHLVYEGEFSKLLLRGVKIAELRFEARRPAGGATAQADGQGQQPAAFTLVSDIESKGFFSKLFGVTFRYHVESTVAADTFSVLRTEKIDEQGQRLRTSEAVFDLGGKRVEWTERNPKDANATPRVVTAALEGPTQDIVSAIYFLRTRRLVPGDQFEMAVSDSGRVYKVPAQVFAEKKKMKSVVGRVSVVRLDVNIFGEGRPVEGKGKMSIWVTDDDRRLPLKARLSHELGQLDITLKRVGRGALPVVAGADEEDAESPATALSVGGK